MAKQEFEQSLHASDKSVAKFEQRSKSLIGRAQHYLHSNPTIVPLIILIGALVIFSIGAGRSFASPYNLTAVLDQAAIICILALAQSIVILTAGIDLSVGAVMLFSSYIMGLLAVRLGVPPAFAIALGVAVGSLAGALNGFFVTKIKLPPFIVTLGTWNIFLASTWLISNSETIRGSDIDKSAPVLKFFAQGVKIVFGPLKANGKPENFTDQATFAFVIILVAVLYILMWYVMNKTAWGRHVYAVGDDKEAAELSGIRSDRQLLQVYTVAGSICGIAAWASIGRLGSISANNFAEANLLSITAVVIGGISLFGGRGSILGPLLGALIVAVFNSGLPKLGLDPQWTVFAIGWLIIIAVAIDQWIRKVSA